MQKIRLRLRHQNAIRFQRPLAVRKETIRKESLAGTDRIRTIDVRLLAGNTAVHADMLMWNYAEPVETAALQLLNVLFSVPQVSVRLEAVPAEHRW